MTPEWITKAAEEATRAELGMADDEPNAATGETTRWLYEERRAAFIAGVELGIAKAADRVDSAGHHWSGLPATAVFLAASAIRALGSDENDREE